MDYKLVEKQIIDNNSWHVSFCPSYETEWTAIPSESGPRLWIEVPLWDQYNTSSWSCEIPNNCIPTLCWFLNASGFYYFWVQIHIIFTLLNSREKALRLGVQYLVQFPPGLLAPNAQPVVLTPKHTCLHMIGSIYPPVGIKEKLLCNTLDLSVIWVLTLWCKHEMTC